VSTKRWQIGPEYEADLFGKLGRVLHSLGYHVGEDWWGVGGSQEVSRWEISGPGGDLVVEAETYVGLSVSGPTELVSVIKERMSF
jgi:hypothetical protein